MSFKVRKAAVLGAGAMGSRIAAHFANAGVDCLLLDLAAKGETESARNGIVAAAHKALLKSRPPALFTEATLDRVEIGNFDDHLARIAEADWIIEAVVENFDAKRKILTRVNELRRPGTLITTNTSGLPVAKLAEGMSDDFRKHWLGTHFFNPPRHMRLVELIPTPDSDPRIVRFVDQFCSRRLGKVVVYAKDRPNFIANRIFLFSFMHTLRAMREHGLTIEEVDALTGPLVGRPRMATFRLADFTGIDVCLFVAETLHRLVPDDEKRDIYEPPDFLRKMVAQGMVGDKAGRGFYKKVSGKPGSERLVLDLDTLEYHAARRPDIPELEQAAKTRDLSQRIKLLIDSPTPAGKFLWETLSELFLYTAARIPEVTDDILSVDTTMRSGFNWERGIFEIWNGLGVEETVERMRREGRPTPPLVDAVLATPEKSFYHERDVSLTYFDLATRRHQPLVDPVGVVRLSSLHRLKKVLQSNSSADLLDLGDGVVCLEFHSKANSLDEGVFDLLRRTIDDLDAQHRALVIGNDGPNFSVGANLAMLLSWCRAEDWKRIGQTIDDVQTLFRSLRDVSKPVVAAVFGQTLAGGCELALHCDHVQAAAETYMGLVEVGAGLIPAAGGCAELMRRHTAGIEPHRDLTPPTRAVFERIGMAKVSGSAAEARDAKLLRPADRITMNRDHLLADARQAAYQLASASYEPTAQTEVLVGGRGVLAALELELYLMHEARFISDYDRHIGHKLATVLAGGPLSQPGPVSEEYLLGLEKEAFLSLCGEKKTQDRMSHILETGKPLRN
ncbi:MAG TPA: 3-hydroxyacyl-CoA dehydrogenase/enoyl-CoA hydratase family protein [Bryobacterales bacterium]|nr:3-hydroxyacyl-CoA dehydrogenase/enoyl-CoA hydratase family protein [Bryobacterales bacterium]